MSSARAIALEPRDRAVDGRLFRDARRARFLERDEPGSRELALDLAAWLAERYAGCATTDDLRLTGRAGWPHRPEELRQLRAGVMD